MTLDIGCGDHPRGDVNWDLWKMEGVDQAVNLGWDLFPAADNSFSLVTACDVLEHIPKVACWRDEGIYETHFPHIQLFNEVWRVLEPGGIFDTMTPILEPAVHGRALHCSVWNRETFDQFCDGSIEDKVLRWHGYTAHFKLVSYQTEGYHALARFKAIK